MSTLLFATHNPGKLKEVKSLLEETKFEIIGLNDLDIKSTIPETSNTIEGNAEQKAAFVKKNHNIDCFADDTGLLVDKLNGAPGVLSARYAGIGASSEQNIEKLLNELDGKVDRRAYFKTCIVLKIGDKTVAFNGICNGTIAQSPRGLDGFGYDPIFIPDGYNTTFAQMSITEKNQISHRAKAIQKFIDYIEAYQDNLI